MSKEHTLFFLWNWFRLVRPVEFKRACGNLATKKWRAGNRAKHRELVRQWRLDNLERSNENRRRYLVKNPDKTKKWSIKQYGLTIQHFKQLFDDQKGLCPICDKAVKLCVDHCHQTKKVRGLLCHRCNTGIGYLGDSISNLERAGDYLRRSAQKQESGVGYL